MDCGPHGAGHFVKMVHNGIEYGVMAAYAEGFNILRNANVGKRTHEQDAETTPLRNPEFYQYEMNLPEITEVWRRGTCSAPGCDLTTSALLEDPELANYGGLRQPDPIGDAARVRRPRREDRRRTEMNPAPEKACA